MDLSLAFQRDYQTKGKERKRVSARPSLPMAFDNFSSSFIFSRIAVVFGISGFILFRSLTFFKDERNENHFAF